MASMNCPSCGKSLEGDLEHCPHCNFALWSAGGEGKTRKLPKWFWWMLGTVIALPCLCVLLGLVAALLAPRVLENLSQAYHGTIKANLLTIDSALKEYAINNGSKFPDSLEPLVRPDVNGRAYIAGGRIPRDPWKRDFLYDPPSPDHPEPRVYTLGKDGRPGGEGDDADLDNLTILDH